jgi:hypothetical protein
VYTEIHQLVETTAPTVIKLLINSQAFYFTAGYFVGNEAGAR